MAQFPALQLWTDAYLGDTSHLTTIEHGAYLLLLIAMWRNKASLPNDDRMLAKYARLTPGQWQRIKPTIWPFFNEDGDYITQGRLTDEYNAVRQRSASASDSARARWLKKNDNGNANASETHCEGNATTATATATDGDGGGGARAREPAPAPARDGDPPAESLTNLPDDAVRLYEQVMAACNVKQFPLPRYWMPPMAIFEVARWRGYGLSDDEIVEVARGSRKSHSDPPDGPKALERSMTIAAGVKVGRKKPQQFTGGSHDRHGDPDAGSEALRRSLARAAEPDKGLDFW